MSDNFFLLTQYDITEDKIKTTPSDEDKLITNYINLIIDKKSAQIEYKPKFRSSNFRDDDSPIDITIHNNSYFY